jgi:GTP cyclohydrolase I
MKPGDSYEFLKPDEGRQIWANSEPVYEAANHITEALAKLGFKFTSGTANTPLRIAKYWSSLLQEPTPIKWTMFEANDTDEMVIVSPIQFESACEHHMLPFYGKAHVGYLPNNKDIVGLSKIARAVNSLANAPQTQEYLTSKIAHLLNEKLKPSGIIVYLEAEHTCMSCRGARAFGSVTHTSKLMGVFSKDKSAKQEFFTIIKNK